MMITLTIMLTIATSMIMMTLSHPLSMGLTLISQTLIISILVGSMSNNFLYSYMLIMIILSGLLVLFIYMTSIASNEKFHSSIIKFIIVMMFLIITFFGIEDPMEMKKMWSSIPKNVMIGVGQVPSLTKLFHLNNFIIIFFLVSILLLMMIIISHIIDSSEGPLRLKN